MARIQFTKESLEGLPVPSTGRLYVHDAETRSLTFCVTATGSRSFYLVKRISGRPERIHIGKFPALTVEEARREAVRLSHDISRGINPQDRKRAARSGMVATDRNSDVARLHFTKQRLEHLTPPLTARTFVYDDASPGLALGVTSTGHKSFYLVKRIAGRPTRVFIGRFGDVTIEQARKAADRLRGEIADGSDPQEEKRRARKQATLGDVFDHYKAVHLEAHCNPRSVREDARKFAKHLDRWRNRPLASLRRDEVAGLHTTIGRNAPIQANRVLELLRRVFNHGRRQFSIDKPNPTEGLKRYREHSRERFLQPSEVRQFFAALNGDPDLDVQDFVKLLLLTGVRKGNLERARWSDLDLARGLWAIPANESKSGEPMMVVLPTAAVAILKDRERIGDDVFRNANGKLPNVVKVWRRIRKAAGLGDLRMHDCRRTLGSWQAALGTSLTIIGKSLGHKSAEATSIYARLTLDPVRESVERATGALWAAAGLLPAPEQGANNGKPNQTQS